MRIATWRTGLVNAAYFYDSIVRPMHAWKLKREGFGQGIRENPLNSHRPAFYKDALTIPISLNLLSVI